MLLLLSFDIWWFRSRIRVMREHSEAGDAALACDVRSVLVVAVRIRKLG